MITIRVTRYYLKYSMELNKEFKQIHLHEFSGYRKNYDALSGKVIDKIAFSDSGNHDENIFIITFTDKTFIAVGTRYKDLEAHDDEPQLENFYVMDPKRVNNGNYGCHVRVSKDGEVRFDEWITILRDLGIWKMSDEEVLKIIEEDKKKETDREYQTYLRLKAKFEKHVDKQ